MAECRLPRGVVFFANAVDHDCRNEARPYCCGVENSVALTTKGCSEHGGPTDRSSDLTKQSFRTGIANLCFAVTPTDSAAQPTFSVPDRHQTKPHPARTSIEAERSAPRTSRVAILRSDKSVQLYILPRSSLSMLEHVSRRGEGSFAVRLGRLPLVIDRSVIYVAATDKGSKACWFMQ